ncbi:PREDICTED: induced myeloid leukemia cell differentiation protein Mcl-1 homolog [Priapulus caudatus]|uniref:Induced myeloid leukemia cell differentiation protein Mcl-1 homolog n=1 Tax=Priapulus caudatus TaxID=37621 RepID=A0ABM1EJ07_PRICU|nr:PREDICTED: induced myeloid leukemia cell differentiation protein Mcl-1 homolog [Priapulus caudatus]
MNHDCLDYEIALHIISCYSGECDTLPRPCKAALTMHKVCDTILSEHEMLYSQLVMRALSDNKRDSSDVIVQVAREVFKDGTINWGRVAALYAFAGKMARYCKANGIETDTLVDSLAAYTSTDLKDWICENGGWNGFVEKFSDTKVEDTLWKGIMWTLSSLSTLDSILSYTK